MNMPGFTAETSLFNSDMHYQATITAATVYGGFVQPAIFDVTNPAMSGLSSLFSRVFDPVYPSICFNCVNIAPPGFPPREVCSVGIRNRITQSCERLMV
jgi:hypothetical protein